MKKFIIATLALAASAAFATEQSHGTAGSFTAQKQAQKTEVVSTSGAVAAAQNAGNSQTITVAPVTTNVASDLKDQGATAAATSAAAAERIAAVNAAAALEIARIQAGDGSRDVAADKNAALDRAAAIEIARINSHQTIKNTPSVNGPQLVTSNDTCMGSTSGSVNIAGLGVGGGSSWVDGNCKMLKNSRELWNMGMKAAALALMCTDDANRAALELTGFECPQTAKAKSEAAAKDAALKAAAVPEYTDPVVRARLGLPTIASSN